MARPDVPSLKRLPHALLEACTGFARIGCVVVCQGTVTSTIPQYEGPDRTRVATFTESGLPLTNVLTEESGDVVSSVVHTREASGRLIEYTTTNQYSDTRLVFSYDDEGRVEQRETYSSDELLRVETWSYDEMGRISATSRTEHAGTLGSCSSEISYPNDSCVPDLGEVEPGGFGVTEVMERLSCF